MIYLSAANNSFCIFIFFFYFYSFFNFVFIFEDYHVIQPPRIQIYFTDYLLFKKRVLAFYLCLLSFNSPPILVIKDEICSSVCWVMTVLNRDLLYVYFTKTCTKLVWRDIWRLCKWAQLWLAAVTVVAHQGESSCWTFSMSNINRIKSKS